MSSRGRHDTAGRHPATVIKGLPGRVPMGGRLCLGRRGTSICPDLGVFCSGTPASQPARELAIPCQPYRRGCTSFPVQPVVIHASGEGTSSTPSLASAEPVVLSPWHAFSSVRQRVRAEVYYYVVYEEHVSGVEL